MNAKLIARTTGELLKHKDKMTLPTGSASDLFNAWSEFKKIQETEITKREQIAADREVRLTAIRESADALRTLINKTFEERGKNFDQFFALLEQGFENDNDKQINAALALIVEQTKVNPMGQAAELISQINDPNVKFIDI